VKNQNEVLSPQFFLSGLFASFFSPLSSFLPSTPFAFFLRDQDERISPRRAPLLCAGAFVERTRLELFLCEASDGEIDGVVVDQATQRRLLLCVQVSRFLVLVLDF